MTTDQQILDLPVSPDMGHISGSMLPEQVIQAVLDQGLKSLKNSPELIEDLFYKLNPQTLADIKTFLSITEIPVRLNFPTDNIVVPLVTILSSSDIEQQNLDVLGDYMAHTFDQEHYEDNRFVGHAEHSEFSIYCIAGKDSNEAMWLYYVVKALLRLNTLTFEAQGMHNLIMNGRDVALRSDLLPLFTFSRVVTLTCDHYFGIRITDKIARSLVIQLFATEPGSDTVGVTLDTDVPQLEEGS